MREDVRFRISNHEFYLDYDYNIKIESYNIPTPEVKQQIQEIPYSNVFYDYTEYFGKPTYKPITIEIKAKLMYTTPCYQKIKRDILNLLHGQGCKLSFVSDSEWWYKGRANVNIEEHNSWNYASINFSILCGPFKTNDEGETSL